MKTIVYIVVCDLHYYVPRMVDTVEQWIGQMWFDPKGLGHVTGIIYWHFFIASKQTKRLNIIYNVRLNHNFQTYPKRTPSTQPLDLESPWLFFFFAKLAKSYEYLLV